MVSIQFDEPEPEARPCLARLVGEGGGKRQALVDQSPCIIMRLLESGQRGGGVQIPHALDCRLGSVRELDGKPVSTFDLIGSSAHTLFILTGKRADRDVAREAIARLARFNAIVRTIVINGPAGSPDCQAVTDPDLRAHRRYGALHGRLLLVRPDGYLACDAPVARPGIPERYLQRLTRGSDQRSKRSPGAFGSAIPNGSPTRARRAPARIS